MRLKVLSDFDLYKAGQIINLPVREAELLLKQGWVIKTKDMITQDMRIK